MSCKQVYELEHPPPIPSKITFRVQLNNIEISIFKIKSLIDFFEKKLFPLTSCLGFITNSTHRSD